MESDRALLFDDSNSIQDKAVEQLKAYGLMKSVLWQSAIHIRSDGSPIEKDQQLLNVDDLYTKCVEIRALLDMHKRGILPAIKERHILERFSYIKTARFIDIMQENIWDGGDTGDEKE